VTTRPTANAALSRPQVHRPQPAVVPPSGICAQVEFVVNLHSNQLGPGRLAEEGWIGEQP